MQWCSRNSVHAPAMSSCRRGVRRECCSCCRGGILAMCGKIQLHALLQVIPCRLYSKIASSDLRDDILCMYCRRAAQELACQGMCERERHLQDAYCSALVGARDHREVGHHLVVVRHLHRACLMSDIWTSAWENATSLRH